MKKDSMQKLRTGFATALLAFTGHVYAQDLPDGTISAHFQELSRAGVLDGCAINFTNLARDTAYRKGAQVVVDGSIALRTVRTGVISFTGKLGTRQLEAPQGSRWEEPAQFFFSSPNGTTAGAVKIMASETPGYKLLIGNVADAKVFALVMDLLKTGEFVAGFNRRDDGQDVLSAVKLNVFLNRQADGGARFEKNESTRQDFANCSQRLIQAVYGPTHK